MSDTTHPPPDESADSSESDALEDTASILGSARALVAEFAEEGIDDFETLPDAPQATAPKTSPTPPTPQTPQTPETPPKPVPKTTCTT